MPRLQVHSKRSWSLFKQVQKKGNSLPKLVHQVRCENPLKNIFCKLNSLYLVAALVNITCCVVEHTKHRDQPVGTAISLNDKNQCELYTECIVEN